MVNTITSLAFLIIICGSTVKAKRKLYEINGQVGGICKELVVRQGYVCEEHTVNDSFIDSLWIWCVLGNN